MEQFIDVTILLLEGFRTNIIVFVLTLLFALPLGLIITFGSISKFKPLAYATKIMIWIIRGTPLILQAIVFNYVPPLLFGFSLGNELTVIVIAFAINYAFYFSEIYRGGIESIPQGQYEAGMVLGMTKPQIFKNVILLQMVKRIMPAMSNEVITLVKDTSLIRAIGYVEIIMVSESLMSAQSIIYPLFYTGVFFLIFSGIVTVVLDKLEKRLSYYN